MALCWIISCHWACMIACCRQRVTGHVHAINSRRAARYAARLPHAVCHLPCHNNQSLSSRSLALRAGWDVFSLRYRLDEPLTTVLTDSAAARLQVLGSSRTCTEART